MNRPYSTFHPFFSVLFFSLLLAGCTTVKATGERHLSLIGESQEIAMGKEANEQIQQSMKLYPDEDLQEYVDQLGQRIAATSERPDLPWEFHVLDDDVVNAFALPGGYIYVTRGIMAYFENEAQLAGVLGHEIGHVTGKHSVLRMSKSVLAQLGMGAAMIFVPELQGLSPVLNAGMQLLFLKYSRDDETESDILGVRYMRNVNENPEELIDVMEMLARVSRETKETSIPQWASTHPHPENRSENIRTHLQSLPPMQYEPVERESYLRRLDGLVYGTDPRDGIVKENAFYHPDMRFKYLFPEGWQVVNQKQAVIGISPNKDAVIQMTLAGQKSAEEALQDMFRQQNISGRSAKRIDIHGIPAVTGIFLAKTDKGIIQGRATILEYRDKVIRIIGYTGQKAWHAYHDQITQSHYSFDKLTDPQYLKAQPLRLDIVTVRSRITLSRFHERNDIPIPLDELARLNQIEQDQILEAGRLMKSVVGKVP